MGTLTSLSLGQISSLRGQSILRMCLVVEVVAKNTLSSSFTPVPRGKGCIHTDLATGTTATLSHSN